MKFYALSLILFYSLSALADAKLTHFGASTIATLPSEDLRVLVWNVHMGKDDHFSVDYPRLASAQDLALLQEANLNHQLPSDVLVVPLAYTHATSFIAPVNKTKMGLMTGSSANPESEKGLVSPVRELRSTSRKASLIQTFALKNSDAKLMVANVHAINFVPNSDFAKHIEQIALALADHQGPMLVAGDFNTWNVQRLELLDNIFDRLQLHRVSFPPGRTRFPNIGRVFGVQTGGELDQVYTRGLTITHKAIHTQITSSDHRPLELHLRLKH